MAIVNSKYAFIMTDVGINGRVSDGGVFSHTKSGKMFKERSLHLPDHKCLPNSARQRPYVFVGDDAFALSENLLKRYRQSELNDFRHIQLSA